MKDTKIGWADDTVNPTSGCDGCELWVPGIGGPCYAGHMQTNRLSKTLPVLYSEDFQEVRLIPGRVAKAVRCMDLTGRPRRDKPWLDGLRRKIFLGDMGDIFSKDVPFDYLKQEVIDVALGQHGSRHDLLCLTKQPARARRFADWLDERGIAWPQNVWLGTSITGRASLKRVDCLAGHPAAVRYLSVEPLVEEVDLAGRLDDIHWVIVGGESTQGEHEGRPFHLRWARDILGWCRDAGAAFFLKQLGTHPVPDPGIANAHGDDWTRWPADLRVREMPATVPV